MAELQKGSKITARGDSSVNVLDFPLGNGTVVATFQPFEHVGYAVDDTEYSDRKGNDPSVFIEVFYFSEDTFLPVAIGYVDIDSVDIGDPEPNSTTAPVEDEKGNSLPESERKEGITVKDPKTGETTVIVAKDSPAAAANKNSLFPTWAKVVIIGVASVIVIVSGVWIYKQLKKPSKKS